MSADLRMSARPITLITVVLAVLGSAASARANPIVIDPSVAGGAFNIGQIVGGAQCAFSTIEPQSGETHLWFTDGSLAGTRVIQSWPYIASMYALQSFFTTTDAGAYFELDGSLAFNDGTPSGTVVLPVGFAGGPAATLPNGQTLFLSSSLLRSDGTSSGTITIPTGSLPTPGLSPIWLATVGNDAYFGSGNVNHDATGLSRTDGTTASSFFTASNGGIVTAVTSCNDSLFFSTYDGSVYELYVTDGTTAPVSLQTFSIFLSANLSCAGTFVFFGATDSTHGFEPWVSDGTAAGTLLLEDINPGSAGSLNQVSIPAAGGGYAYFAADDGVHGVEPWMTDGTPSSTMLAADVAPGSASSDPAFIFGAPIAGKALFTTASGFYELIGTTLTDIYPSFVAAGVVIPQPPMAVLGTKIIFQDVRDVGVFDVAAPIDAPDAGAVEAGIPDAQTLDANVADAPGSDAVALEGGSADARIVDASRGVDGALDSGDVAIGKSPEAGTPTGPDAGMASGRDAALAADGSGMSGATNGGCGCMSAGTTRSPAFGPSLGALMMSLGLGARRRKRRNKIGRRSSSNRRSPAHSRR